MIPAHTVRPVRRRTGRPRTTRKRGPAASDAAPFCFCDRRFRPPQPIELQATDQDDAGPSTPHHERPAGGPLGRARYAAVVRRGAAGGQWHRAAGRRERYAGSAHGCQSHPSHRNVRDVRAGPAGPAREGRGVRVKCADPRAQPRERLHRPARAQAGRGDSFSTSAWRHMHRRGGRR